MKHCFVDEVLRSGGADMRYIEQQAQAELREIARRRVTYLRGRPAVEVAGRSVILVDDGIATGTTVRAALKALRLRQRWMRLRPQHDVVKGL